MKAIKFLIVCLFVSWLPSLDTSAQSEDEKYITVSGVVKDRSNKRELSHASVTVVGQETATVTNADGEFILKIPSYHKEMSIDISHMGYLSSRIKIDNRDMLGQTFWLTPSSNLIGEIVVEGYEPRSLVKKAVEKIAHNYDPQNRLLTGFYRETAKKKRHFINISEAIVNIYKTSYKEDHSRDKTAIEKGRKLVSTKLSDTLAVKLIGGPNIAVNLDIVKNIDLLFSPDEMENYDYHMEDITDLNGRLQYVVCFAPRRIVPYALYVGKIYIDKERLSVTRIDFSLDLSDRLKAVQAILKKKPGGLIFKPQEVAIHVDYTEHDGVSYLSYIQDVIRFKCDWKKKLFHTNYTVTAEMVITDRKSGQSADIPRKMRFNEHQVLSDNVTTFYDENFWGPYNIIQPDESLDKAIERLKKQHKPQNG
ncbi:carboxypeptidase-like regulatory domain-containing protein [Phocaeicola abscessus]